MARIIVTADPTEQGDAPVLLEERIYSVHVTSDHGAAQLVQRLGWAIADAESRETGQPLS